MKHKSLLSLLFLVVALFCDAQVISQQQARQKAMSFMQQQGMAVKKGIVEAPLTLSQATHTPFYVFNATEDKGFVIVSADKRTEEILAYDMDSQFDEKRLCETMRIWLEDYAAQIDAIQNGHMATKPMHIENHAPIGKLVSTAWGQGDDTETGEAYNQLCPTIGGMHCVTGCAATAMAQVMRYHEWPKSNTAVIPGYTPNDDIGYLSSLPKIKFSWNDMLDRYDEGQTAAQEKAVAQLMLYCGQALEMNYGTDASSASASSFIKALRNYFDYDVNTRYVRRTDYSAEAWDNLIYNELKNGRPVIYHGSNPGGGHAFVCDGYDGQGFYHINWGWDGKYNGFFKLSILNPRGGGTGSSASNNGYSSDQGAVVGIQKPTSTTDEKRTLTLEDFTRDGHTLTAEYCNRTGLPGDFDYGFAYQDAAVGGNSFKVRKTTEYYDTYDTHTSNLNLDNMSLSDGTYRFYPYAILSGCGWYHVIGDYKKFYEVVFSGGQVTSVTYHPRAHLVITNVECVSNRIVNQPQEVAITVRNDGEEFTDLFYLFASKTNEKGEAVDQVCMPIESGSEEQTSLFFLPDATGKWKVWLDIVEDGSNNISPWEVDIKAAPTSATKLSVVSYEIDTYTDAVFRVKIRNNNSDGYYMPILCYLFEDGKTYNIAYDKTQNLNIAPGQTTELTFRFESLQMGHSYAIRLRAYADHQTKTLDWLGSRYTFTVDGIFDPVDVPEISHHPTVSSDVYSISGVLIKKNATTLDGLPKGIYIVNGKKVVKD
ncbi:MAG: C10 family peptidase [Prevotella sp.]|nr:C10 family peptidase [Prevotella sp.]